MSASDVLVRVTAASFTPTELAWPSTWTDRSGRSRTPVIPGHELCGVVAGLGYGSSGFEPGDPVYGLSDWYRRLADQIGFDAVDIRDARRGGTQA
jgi:NADPH:quinone reductase-like Zn-dependent oxidoreductase